MFGSLSCVDIALYLGSFTLKLNVEVLRSTYALLHSFGHLPLQAARLCCRKASLRHDAATAGIHDGDRVFLLVCCAFSRIKKLSLAPNAFSKWV